jgi:hypothetical protein
VSRPRRTRYGQQYAPVNDVAISPNRSLLATAGADGRARLWDLSTGRYFGVLIGDNAPLNSVAFSSDGRFVVAASDDEPQRSGEPKAPSHFPARVLRGPFAGRAAAAYRQRPPDDKVRILARTGRLRLTRDGAKIARLVVIFGEESTWS